MKCRIIIDPHREEEVLVYAHEKSALVQQIAQLVTDEEVALVGYRDKEAFPLTPSEVVCFTVEDGKVFAVTDHGTLWVKCRLYQLEERLPDGFVKINQSCIANIRRIARFDASLGGTLTVIFQNGQRDYVSRRNVKKVKERLGL